jgi:hypothetical protein
MVKERGREAGGLRSTVAGMKSTTGKEKKNGFQIRGGKLYAPYGCRKGGGKLSFVSYFLKLQPSGSKTRSNTI